MSIHRKIKFAARAITCFSIQGKLFQMVDQGGGVEPHGDQAPRGEDRGAA